MLEHIFQVKESIEHSTGFTRESEIESEIEYVGEKIFIAIYRQLLFMRKKNFILCSLKWVLFSRSSILR